MSVKSFALIISFFLVFSPITAQNPVLKLDGKNYGRNLIVSNPFAPSGIGFSIMEININGKIPEIEITGSVFEIDFSALGFGLNDSIHLKITYKTGGMPFIYNPEAIIEKDLESIPSLDHTRNQISYYLKDKSLCIIKGKVISERNGFDHNFYHIVLKTKNGPVLNFINTDKYGNFVGILHFDQQCELQILKDENNEILKKVLLDLRGVPADKQKGELIYVDFLIANETDKRLSSLNSEFANKKLYYDVGAQTLKWDEDFSNVISKATESLIKQIDQEKSIRNIELDRKSKQIEIEKNKADLAIKTAEIDAKNTQLLKESYDKKIKEGELLAKSILISDEQNKKKYLYAIILFVSLVLIGSILAFLRQKKLKELVEIQRREAEHQKQLVIEKQKEVMDSIYYARRIQQALITNENYIDKHLKRLMHQIK